VRERIRRVDVRGRTIVVDRRVEIAHLIVTEAAVKERAEVVRVKRKRRGVFSDRGRQVAIATVEVPALMVEIGRAGRVFLLLRLMMAWMLLLIRECFVGIKSHICLVATEAKGGTAHAIRRLRRKTSEHQLVRSGE
jgi:hypothetical protein